MYFRVKRTGTYGYLQIVESFREKGHVHQRVLSTVGRLDVLQASGQFEALMRSGLRFCEKLAVIDAHAAGQTARVRQGRRTVRGVDAWGTALRGEAGRDRCACRRPDRACPGTTSWSGPGVW